MIQSQIADGPDRNLLPPLDLRALRTMMGTAAYHASMVGRTMRLRAIDREDVEQDILLALLERRRFFDPTRGAWSSFADRVARQAAQVAADQIGADRRNRGGSLDEPVTGDVEGDEDAVTRGEAQLSSGLDPEQELWLPRALARFVAELPSELGTIAKLALNEDGDLAAAQRQSGLSTSEFYRRLREVRYRLVCAGIVRRRLSGAILNGPSSDSE